jgi:aldehyde dehydrogenase (NAD(P)+)
MDTVTSYPVVLGAVGAVSAYLLLRSSPQQVDVAPAPVLTQADQLDPMIERVAHNAQKWVDTPLQRKLDYLREMLAVTVQIADQVTAASDKVRHLENTPFAGTSGLYSSGYTAGYLRQYIMLYESLVATGAPPAPVSRRQSGDTEVARTGPRGVWEKVTNPVVVELFSMPGKKLTQPNPVKFHPGVCAVMSPGNFEAPSDALYQLFVEGRVVVVKSHPLNGASSELLASAVFASLVRDGFVGLCAGGPEVGGKLLQHKAVDSWMMTGGCGTFDAIVWGGKAGKAAGKKQLNKTCHSELGAASPYVVVPGAWSDKEVDDQAAMLVGYKMLNSGHICASPQVIVVDRQWAQAKRFVASLEEQLDRFPAFPTYYIGTADRMAAIKANCPATRVINKDNNFHFVPDVDAEGGGGDYMLRNESFGPALAIKYIDAGGDPRKFLDQAVQFSNTQVFGSLSMSIAISPASLAAIGKDEFDNAIKALRWGTVGVNLWAAFAAGNAAGVWGAPPGRHTDQDIQSGSGQMGNAFMLQNIDKTVIRGTWCDPMMLTMLRPSPKASAFGQAFNRLQVHQSFGALFGVLKTSLF